MLSLDRLINSRTQSKEQRFFFILQSSFFPSFPLFVLFFVLYSDERCDAQYKIFVQVVVVVVVIVDVEDLIFCRIFFSYRVRFLLIFYFFFSSSSAAASYKGTRVDALQIDSVLLWFLSIDPGVIKLGWGVGRHRQSQAGKGEKKIIN